MRSRILSYIHLTLPVLFLLTFALWALNSIAKVLFNGLYLDLDYGLFHPDGAFYTFRTLLFAGYDKVEAGQIVSDWYATYPSRPGESDPTSLYFENAPGTWDQYLPRVLYPLLSAPFVKLFGVWGMLVIPALTYLAVLLVAAYVAYKIGRPEIGLLAVILITSSITISRWMYINSTDALLMLFPALFILFVFRNLRLKLSNLSLLALLVLIYLSSLTRFSALMWIAIGLVFLAQKSFKEGLLIVATAIASSIPIFLRPFGNDVLPELNEKSPLEKILFYPVSLARISVYEVGQLFVLDRIFFWTLLLGLVLALMNWRRIESQFLLASFISLWITGSLNAVLGVNFRYQLAVIPFLLWALIALLPSLQWTHSRSLRDIFVKEV